MERIRADRRAEIAANEKVIEEEAIEEAKEEARQVGKGG